MAWHPRELSIANDIRIRAKNTSENIYNIFPGPGCLTLILYHCDLFLFKFFFTNEHRHDVVKTQA